jgi:hypothetical protein
MHKDVILAAPIKEFEHTPRPLNLYGLGLNE